MDWGFRAVFALRCGSRGRYLAHGSIAVRIDLEADVAQLVEQLIRNQQVNGSSPFVGSIGLPGIPCQHCSGSNFRVVCTSREKESKRVRVIHEIFH